MCPHGVNMVKVMQASSTYKNSLVKARVNSELKHQADKVLKKLGVSMSEIINALLAQIKLTQSVPFQLRIPNEETLQAMRETEQGIGLVECKDIDDLFEKLELSDAKDKIQKRLSKRSQACRKKR